MDAIRIEHLTKRYKDVVAVDGLSLAVGQGELFSLLGVNGAGKTTTVKMLSCLTEPTSGNAFLHGKSIKDDAAAVKSMIAVSPQETAVARGLSVRENLELICGVHGFDKDKKNKKIAELAEKLGLQTVMHKKAGKLSGGWQRRLSIAMALISEPKILFLDEPTLGLDVLAKRDLIQELKHINRERGVTLVVTSHDMDDLRDMASRLVLIHQGSIRYDGSFEALASRRADFESVIAEMYASWSPEEA